MFDIIKHLYRQREFSLKTFGPGKRRKGVADHIRKELKEIEADPDGKGECEWIDVIILGFDGALRDGKQPEEIIDLMVGKQTKNEGRDWPDWRLFGQDKAIEHDRSGEMLMPLDSPAPSPQVVAVKTSIDTMREAAKDLLVKNGWKPGSLISGHSAAELMAAFGMQVYRGEVGCDYPDCGCCADAACGDAVKQHPDLGGTPIAIATEGSGK